MKHIFKKKRIAGIIVIIAVIIIPLLYSYFYLGAFWDPYSRLESLPVAVVNNDAGAIINDTNRNIGKELCDQLQENAALKFIITSEQDARSGTEGNDYYAMIVIPENFSANIASSGTDNKQTAMITYSANEKRNYLASQILSKAVMEIETSMRSKVNKEIVQGLVDHMNEVPSQMLELTDGLSKLQDGSTSLAEGTSSLSDGTAAYYGKMKEYQKGMEALTKGSKQLSSGITALGDGLQDLKAGAKQLTYTTSNLDQLTSGAKTLAEGTEAFHTNLNTYTSGVGELINSVNNTSEFLKQYVTTINPSIMKDPVFAAFITKLSDPSIAQNIEALQTANDKLNEASSQLSAGASALSFGTENLPQLKAAIATLSSGITKAQVGSEEVMDGSNSLSNNMEKASDATAKLTDAAEDLSSGASTLQQGSKELSKGITSATSAVNTGIEDTNYKLSTLDGLADYAEAPVHIEHENINPVPNYGTAFAPYFLSLSLWVGALIMFVSIYLDTDGKFKILSKETDRKVARSFLYLLIGLIQALVLAEALRFGLGLKVENLLLYYSSCCLVSIVFISIVQFLMVHLNDVGKFLCIVLLILQLTSCGGTFPMETVPRIFNVLYPFMPMTYSVGLFRQAISGVETSVVISNVVILSYILVAFMSLTVLFSLLKSKRELKMKAQII